MKPKPIAQWQEMNDSGDYSALGDILAEDAVFRSPVVQAPQAGRALTAKYLRGAMRVCANASFHYVEEWIGERSAVLEFEVEIEGVAVNGVDIIHWNDDERIVEFKVMVRPLKAINLLHEMIGRAVHGAA